uniref:Uncharacterized protein n=1 Tax=viral metagenome TaxID=1070528 RepID=A0A6C0LS68_9ZZZZ
MDHIPQSGISQVGRDFNVLIHMDMVQKRVVDTHTHIRTRTRIHILHLNRIMIQSLKQMVMIFHMMMASGGHLIKI